MKDPQNSPPSPGPVTNSQPPYRVSESMVNGILHVGFEPLGFSEEGVEEVFETPVVYELRGDTFVAVRPGNRVHGTQASPQAASEDVITRRLRELTQYFAGIGAHPSQAAGSVDSLLNFVISPQRSAEHGNNPFAHPVQRFSTTAQSHIHGPSASETLGIPPYRDRHQLGGIHTPHPSATASQGATMSGVRNRPSASLQHHWRADYFNNNRPVIGSFADIMGSSGRPFGESADSRHSLQDPPRRESIPMPTSHALAGPSSYPMTLSSEMHLPTPFQYPAAISSAPGFSWRRLSGSIDARRVRQQPTGRGSISTGQRLSGNPDLRRSLQQPTRRRSASPERSPRRNTDSRRSPHGATSSGSTSSERTISEDSDSRGSPRQPPTNGPAFQERSSSEDPNRRRSPQQSSRSRSTSSEHPLADTRRSPQQSTKRFSI